MRGVTYLVREALFTLILTVIFSSMLFSLNFYKETYIKPTIRSVKINSIEKYLVSMFYMINDFCKNLKKCEGTISLENPLYSAFIDLSFNKTSKTFCLIDKEGIVKVCDKVPVNVTIKCKYYEIIGIKEIKIKFKLVNKTTNVEILC